jgi:1-acyl-sn-glycerol-3-phosphate acyltransferase
VALRRVLPGDQPPGRPEPAPASALRGSVDRGPSAARKTRRPREKPPDAGLGTLLEQLLTADLDPADPASRDPAFIKATAPFFDFLWNRYFRAEVEGAEHVPASGPFIAVGNHSGGPLLPDVWLKLAYWSRRYGTDRPAYAMVHDLPLAVPIVKNLLLKLGALRASPENAERALAKGGAVLIYPGGDADCLRSFWKRNTVDFFGHTGFVKLALRHDVPILPVVNVGAHEVYFTLFSSRALARWSGIEALTRVKTVPLNFGLPWGMWLTGFLPYLPLPSKIVYKVGKPIRCSGGPARADDPATVQRVYRRVTRVMQQMVDDLASRRRLPVVG